MGIKPGNEIIDGCLSTIARFCNLSTAEPVHVVEPEYFFVVHGLTSSMIDSLFFRKGIFIIYWKVLLAGIYVFRWPPIVSHTGRGMRP